VFLDAWLGLAIWGPVVLLVILLVVPVLGFTLFRAVVRCRRLLHEGEPEQAMLEAVLVVLFCVPIVAIFSSFFVDTREERHLVLDLRKTQRALLTELRRCAYGSDTYCDSDRYSVTALIILPEGLRLSIRTESLHWSLQDGSTVSIQVRDADASELTLQAAHQLLMQYVKALPDRRDAEMLGHIDEVSARLLRCCKGSEVYSEASGIQLTPQFGLQFYKNVDQVAVEYVVKRYR
jgi:hypothetical protein